jgi:DNA-binding phage protein
MTSKLTRSHDEATIERLRKDPQFAAEYLDAILKDGDKLLQALQRFRTLGINSNIKLGSLLAQFGAEAGGLDLDITRDPTPAEPASFE